MASKRNYRGSERYGCRVWIYGHGIDPIVADSSLLLSQQPNYLSGDAESLQPALVRASCSTRIGRPGSFSITVKVPKTQEFTWLESFPDDSWVDIEFTVNGVAHHVFRGLKISDSRSISINSGATSTEFTIEGQGFQRIFTQTRTVFNRFGGENILGGAALRSDLAVEGFFGSRTPSAVTRAFLYGLIETLESYGRTLWLAPSGVPSIPAATGITDWLPFIVAPTADQPFRQAISPNWQIEGNGDAWSLAQTWMDADLTECFVDLTHKDGSLLLPGRNYERKDTRVGVIFRRRPFPDAVGQNIETSPWADLPEVQISPQDIASGRTDTRSGDARVNWVELGTQYIQRTLQSGFELQAPLADVQSCLYHGARQRIIQSRYEYPNKDDMLGMRSRYYQWHALGGYFREGTIPLAHGRPDIRVGTKFQMERELGYIEGVRHQFTAGHGAARLRTSLSYSRGWIGDERSLYRAIAKAYDNAKVLTTS